MKAKFIGDPREGSKRSVPEEITVYGVTFEQGKFAEVPDHLASKFAGNDHFEVQGKEPEPDDTPARAPRKTAA